MRPRRAGSYARRMRTDRAWRRFLDAGWLVSIIGMLVAGRMWQLHLREAEQRAEEAERTRDEVALRKAVEERLRIARELHDSLTHSISVIQVQAGVAAHLARKRGEEVPAALAAIQEASADASRELRATLGVLRASDDSDSSGLRQLAALVARARAAGLPVTVTVTGPERQLTPDVDQAAYPDRARGAHERHQARGPGLRDRAPAVRARPADGAGRQRRRRNRQRPGLRYSRTAADLGDGPDRDARAGIRARWPARRRAQGGRGIPGLGRAPGPGRVVIRILLADDQALIRSGIRSLLDAEDDIEVVGEAVDGREAVALAAEHRPDIALVDIQMPVLDGIEATRQIVADERLASVRVVILTNFGLDEYIFRALRAGASGFLLKDTEPAELLQALRVVMRGDSLLSPAVTRSLISEFVARPPDAVAAAGMEGLTNREREVVALVAHGLSNDEIAAAMVLSPATAKTHVSRAMIKLGARDRAQLVVFAYQAGLVSPRDSAPPRPA